MKVKVVISRIEQFCCRTRKHLVCGPILAALFAVFAAVPAFAEWSLDGNTATDGSWTLTVAEDEIDGVTGLKVTSASMGTNTDLNLSDFEAGTGRQIIRLNKLFQWNTSLTSLVAPTVLRVEASFNECSNGSITNVQLDACTYIGGSAFNGCSKLKTVKFSDDITYIGGTAFYQASSVTFDNPHWPKLETLGGSFSPSIKGDVQVESLGQILDTLGKSTITSVYAPSATSFAGAIFKNATSLTNLTFKGSATALDNSANNWSWGGNALKTINWIGNEAPTTMPSTSLGGGNVKFYRMYVNADKSQTVQAWAYYCKVTAKQIASGGDYAVYQKLSGYNEVKDKLIGCMGSAYYDKWNNAQCSAYNGNGPCWIINTADVEEEETIFATITAPEHSKVETVKANGYVVKPNSEGKYEMLSTAKVAITYRADAGWQFEGKLSVYTEENIDAAETIGPDDCTKTLSAVTYRTLTLSASDLAAKHIASVKLTMDEPYLCVTNGDSIVYSLYEGVSFKLTYTAVNVVGDRYRFEGGAKTSVTEYADGITSNTVIAADDLPKTSVLICKWTRNGGTISDGNWSFNVDEETIDGVKALRLRQYYDGGGDLDLTKFLEESGSAQDVIATINWSVFPKNTTRIVAPGILKFGESSAAGIDIAELIAPNAVYFDTSCFRGCTKLTNVVFSANVKRLNSGCFADCSALTTLGNTEWPELTTIGDAFRGTKIVGDIRMPKVTGLLYAFASSKITSIYAPKCEIFDYGVVSGCSALTNVVIKGSANCFNTTEWHGTMSGVGKVETFRYLGEEAPTYLPQASIYSALTEKPMMLYVNLKGTDSRAGWEKLCTVKAEDIKTNANYAAYKTIPNYKTVRKALVGYIGTVTMAKDGSFASVGAKDGNGPCWVVDGNWPVAGFTIVIR